MSRAYGKRLKLRLFLEGAEVPIIAANVQCGPNSPIVATLQIPPLAEGTRLLPRTLVHLFFLDLYDNIWSLVSQQQTKEQLAKDRQQLWWAGGEGGNPEAYNEANFFANEALHHYKLIFGGEVVGFQWQKTANGNVLVLQCVDWSNYWDYAYQWSNTDIFGPGLNAIFSGGATNLFTDFLSSKGSTVTNLIAAGRCDSFPNLKGLTAGMIRIIEAVGGIYFPAASSDGKPVKQYAGQNIFFSLAELRLHLTHMLGALQSDPTSENLLRFNGWMGMMDRMLGSSGGQTSVRQVLSALSQVMFYEIYAQPCPRYDPGLNGSAEGRIRKRLAADPSTQFIITEGEALSAGAMEVKTALQAAVTASAAELTIIARDRRLQLANMRKRCNGMIVRISQMRRPELETAKGIFSTVSIAFATAMARLQAGWRPKAPEAVKKIVYDKLDEADTQLRRLIDLTISTTTKVDIKPARLLQQIIRPDCWFTAPPRCNVLFPEHYTMLRYQRSFLQEPTRFLLKTTDEFFGEGFLFDQFFFAPQAGTIEKQQTKNLQDLLKNNLFDHELFTGILPVFEKMGEMNVFASRAFDKREGLARVSYAQRTCNFMYFKHRFNSRQMSVRARFNPYVACGFPGLIIDKYVDPANIAIFNAIKRDIVTSGNASAFGGVGGLLPENPLDLLGTSFLGNFTMVTHNISQEGTDGMTEIVCSYPRQPEESIEFLGAVDKERKIKVREDVPASRATAVAALQPPPLYSIGPNGGRVVLVVDVTDEYRVRNVNRSDVDHRSGRNLPIYAGAQRNPSRERLQLIPIGIPVTGTDYGSSLVTELAGGSDVPITFRAYVVTEEVPRYTREQIELPAEEYIRPGWYGDVWRASQVGKAYDEFFRTGAITDPQNILDLERTSVTARQLTRPEATEQASEEAQDVKGIDDPRLDAPAITALQEGATIAQAVEFLLLVYSYMRQNGIDIDEFIWAYTWRPIATMVDIFGSQDLKLDTKGSTVEEGQEGFHSRAFGPYDDIFGLVGPDLVNIVGIQRDSPTAQRGDTRKRKQEAVLRYVAALKIGRGLLG